MDFILEFLLVLILYIISLCICGEYEIVIITRKKWFSKSKMIEVELRPGRKYK